MNTDLKTPTESLLEVHARLGEEWNKAKELLKTVKIEPTKSVKGVDLTRIKAKPHSCYLNALAVCMVNPEVKYVEGYIEVHGVPLDHAWNYYNGVYFDVTEEVIDSELKDCPHRAIMVLSSPEVMGFAAEKSVSGPYLQDWLKKSAESS